MKPGILLLVLLLAGCGGNDHEDLRQWMAESSKGLRGGIPPLPQVRPYEPVAYDAQTAVSPFSSGRLRGIADRKGAGMPDLNRPREPLEEFPLETMKFVGLFQDKKRLIAQVLVNGKTFDVRVGSYIGQNFGKVTAIVTAQSDEKILLKELVQEPDGAWVERQSELRLASKGN